MGFETFAEDIVGNNYTAAAAGNFVAAAELPSVPGFASQSAGSLAVVFPVLAATHPSGPHT